MLIRYATLAALRDFPQSVSEVYREVAPLVSLFRPLASCQIRNTLHRLQLEGLAATTARPEENRPALIRTPAGHRALDKWFRTPPARAEALDARQARVLYAAAQAPSTTLQIICRNDAAHLRHRQRLLQVRQQKEASDTPAAWLLRMAIEQIEIEQLWLEEHATPIGKSA